MSNFKSTMKDWLATIRETLLDWSDLNHRALRGRMVLLSFVPLLIMFSISLVVLLQVQSLSKNLSNVIENTVPAVTTSKDLAGNIVEMSEAMNGALDPKNSDDDMITWSSNFESAVDRFSSALDRYMAIPMPEKADKLRLNVKKQWEILNPILEQMKKTLNEKKRDEIEKLARGQLKDKFYELKDSLSNIELNNTDIVEKEKESAKEALRGLNKTKILSGSIAVIIFCLIVSVILSGRISFKLNRVIEKLFEESKATQNQSMHLSKSAESLSNSNNKSASAIQETSAAVAEILSMAEMNENSASESTRAAKDNVENIKKGKESLGDLIRGFEEILRTNDEVSNVVSKNNESADEILKVFKQIADKTIIINDIVFQTKLLSFNASVEAARAGEAGKGFAVVASEIGNLATNSGKAASEISELLESSKSRISLIVEENIGNIEKVAKRIKESVDHNKIILDENHQILEIISMKSQNIEEVANNISGASTQQNSGLGEISNSLHQLEQVTQQNMSDGIVISQSSKKLLDQANTLDEIIHQLKDVVKGRI